MARFDPAGSAGRAVRAAKTTDWRAKAKQAAASLKADYEAGKSGDEAPATPIWPSPKEQLDKLLGLLRSVNDVPLASDEQLADDADKVSAAMGRVDWTSVRQATADKTSEATKAMKTMADQVDWAKVQPVAAQVSTSLIAAVASGQLGLGGPIGSMVARTIANQGGLAQRVGQQLDGRTAAVRPDFSDVIATTATDS